MKTIPYVGADLMKAANWATTSTLNQPAGVVLASPSMVGWIFTWVLRDWVQATWYNNESPEEALPDFVFPLIQRQLLVDTGLTTDHMEHINLEAAPAGALLSELQVVGAGSITLGLFVNEGTTRETLNRGFSHALADCEEKLGIPLAELEMRRGLSANDSWDYLGQVIRAIAHTIARHHRGARRPDQARALITSLLSMASLMHRVGTDDDRFTVQAFAAEHLHDLYTILDVAPPADLESDRPWLFDAALESNQMPTVE